MNPLFHRQKGPIVIVNESDGGCDHLCPLSDCSLLVYIGLVSNVDSFLAMSRDSLQRMALDWNIWLASLST